MFALFKLLFFVACPYQICPGIYTIIISSNHKKIFKQKLNVQ